MIRNTYHNFFHEISSQTKNVLTQICLKILIFTKGNIFFTYLRTLLFPSFPYFCVSKVGEWHKILKKKPENLF